VQDFTNLGRRDILDVKQEVTGMASAKFNGGKWKGATEAKAQFRHNVQDTRRKDKHSNEHLNTALTHTNTAIMGDTYRTICDKYDERIADLDGSTNKNKRKDRVTMVSVEIPVPDGLPADKIDGWYARIWEIAGEMWGRDNMLDLTIHRDEVHEYVEPESKEKRMSKVHGHLMFIPEREGQLNAKWATKRENIVRFNTKIHDMTQAEYGIRFHDGSKKRGCRTVEEMKERSKEAEVLFKEREALDKRKAEVERQEAALRASQAEFQKNREIQGRELENRFKRLQEALEADRRELDEMTEFQDGRIKKGFRELQEAQEAFLKRQALNDTDRAVLQVAESLNFRGETKTVYESLKARAVSKGLLPPSAKPALITAAERQKQREADAEAMLRRIRWGDGQQHGKDGPSL